MKRRNVNFALIMALYVLAALFVVRFSGQTAAAQAGKLVPDNRFAAKVTQPITLNHKKHLAKGMQCESCHENPAPGNLMTFAATGTCMTCHSSTLKNDPEVKKLAQFDKSKKPVPWVRVYQVLPGVKWTHKKHLDAGFKCEECHGQVAQMDVMTEATSVASKSGCINCHGARIGVKAKSACSTCHGWFEDPAVPSVPKD